MINFLPITSSIRGLLGTVVVFGICLIALYGVEIWVARKLLEAVQDVVMLVVYIKRIFLHN